MSEGLRSAADHLDDPAAGFPRRIAGGPRWRGAGIAADPGSRHAERFGERVERVAVPIVLQ